MDQKVFADFSKISAYKKDEKPFGFVKETLSILISYSAEFLQKRTPRYLCKVATTRFLISERFSKIPLDGQRHIYTKFLSVKFQGLSFQKKALGIALSFRFFSSYEKFEYEHLLQVLKKILPGIHIVDKSFYHSIEQNRCFCYFEIEKIRGKTLSMQECFKLKKLLPQEIKDGIEFLSPHLFAPVNEEEIFRNIQRLDKEVISFKDIPHVIVSFQDQNDKTIRFSIVLIRIMNENDPSIRQLLCSLSVQIQFHVEKKESLGNGHIKEITSFSLELKGALFSRKNHLIDLIKARQYICVLLENIVGEFRDFNGGLLSKQTEQFDLIKKDLKEQFRDISDFEELFYLLRPSNIQLLISSEVAVNLCELFYELKDQPLKEPLVMRTFKSKKAFFILVKTSLYIEDIFSNLSSELLVAKASKIIEQQKYHCLIQINPADTSLAEHVQKDLTDLQKKMKKHMKEELRITFQHSLLSFHPHLSVDIRSHTLCKALFEGLTRVNPQGIVELALAESVDISPCKKIYQFKLKPSKWSNGKSLSSYDFATSWKRAINSQSNCIGGKNFFIIKNAKKAHQDLLSLEEVGIYTPSESELMIELEYPASYFLQLVANPIYSPIYQADITEEPSIFNGPFLPTTYKLGEKIELVSNPLYWDAKSLKLRRLTIEIIKDSYKAYQKYKQGELDLIGSPFSPLPEEVSKTSDQIQYYETHIPFWLFCNTKNPKLKSAKIRRALSYAINREKLIQQMLPFQKVSYSIIPKKFSFLTIDDCYLEDDKEKAIFLFEEGLQEVGLKKEDFELNLNRSNFLEQKKLSYFLKDTWEETFDIKVNLIENSWNAHWNTFFNREYEIGGFYVINGYQDPFYFMERFEEAYNHHTKWENPRYQKYFSLAKNSVDEEERKDHLRKAEEILMDQMPVIPICNRVYTYLSKRNLKDFSPSTFAYSDFKWAYFDD